MNIVLGSSSPFRQELLKKLGVTFKTDVPDIDESRMPNEEPEKFVQRLALEKARAVASRNQDSLVIGSDQVACIDGTVLGKPGNKESAIEQLSAASGKKVCFFTGLCLLNSNTGDFQLVCEPFHVHFRTLEQVQIERYLDAEKPYNCAGSFKSEGLGISLFERLEGDDPNSLIGLPLIRLISMFAKEGVHIP